MNKSKEFKFLKKEKVFAGCFIIVLVLAFVVSKNSSLSLIQKNIITTGSFFLLFLATLSIFSDVLKKESREFKQKIWLKVLISIGLMIGIVVLLQLTRKILPPGWLVNPSETTPEINLTLLGVALPMIQPLLAPFYEEMMFRYLFISKANSQRLKIAMTFIQAIVFGLLHTANFGGNWLATIPYMVIAFYFGVIYLVSRNIWYSITVHFFFNFMSAVVPVLIYLPFLFK